MSTDNLACTVVSVLMISTACGATPTPTKQDSTCMTATHITEKAHNRNVITLCRRHEHATQEITFASAPLYDPTTCHAEGTVADSRRNKFIYRFQPGTCDNGRHTKRARYDCEVIGSEITCAGDGVRLVFSMSEEQD